ncbi:hypothetical protein C1I98_29020 [Spongiactinospora gelatinilytica]|uniref:Uncharacterized protein n=1 Tax=Spongiactinospora gelatinilytica TaxID=2666298 RepID=A0A2W2FSI4_9ACTN|nr:hypothetical protein [Spongiactinospora gelatinilytica]PZG33039.1 hypothetical protein C1I98_29020 [Spongiactinospora gelatinilytica]
MYEIRDPAGRVLGTADTMSLAEARLDELTHDRPGEPRRAGTWTIVDTETGVVAAELTRYDGPSTPFRSILATLAHLDASSPEPPEEQS